MFLVNGLCDGPKHSSDSKCDLGTTVIELDTEPEEVRSGLVLHIVVVLSAVATATRIIIETR